MKKGLLVILIALLAGLTAFYISRWRTSSGNTHSQAIALPAMSELDWLKKDLQLTDAQFIKVRDLHIAYRPKCMEMCSRIAKAHEKVETLAATSQEITPEYKSALEAHASVQLECQFTMLQHLYETAATLDPEQRRRYLKTMLPYALDVSHGDPGNHHAP